MTNILFILLALSLANSDITVDIGSTVTIECVMPGNYTADTVTLIHLNSNRRIAMVIPSYHTNIKQCYMDGRTYKFTLRNISREQEGKYICRFSALTDTIYETSFILYVFPSISAYSLKGHEQNILYICNRSISLYDNRVRSEIIVGGVSIQGKDFIKSGYTNGYSYFYTVGSMDYEDWARIVMCAVTFNGFKRENVLTVTYNVSGLSINIPTVYTSDIIHVV